MDLSKLSMAELKDLLGKALKEEKNRAKSDLVAARNEIFAIAQRLNMPLSDLIGSGRSKSSQKVAVKYRNPANSTQEWTGRGRPPHWVKEMLEAGADLQTAKVDA